MFKEYRGMSRFAGLVAATILFCADCTRPNPRSCLDGSCTDPAFPYCDADGQLAGKPDTCIAVSCTPGELIACHEDNELRCNVLGGDYDLVDCALGCIEGAGCRLCEPNKAACTNGVLATCDSNGTPLTSEVCELGCADAGAACKRIAPSNNLGGIQDLVVNPPKITAVSAVFNTDDGTVTSAGLPLSVPTALVPASAPNPAIRVWIVDAIDIDAASFTSTASGPLFGPAVAILARRDIKLHGTISVAHQVGGVLNGCVGASPGVIVDVPPELRASGGGGGGNGTAGGRGGSDSAAGGVAGAASGTAALVPLRGGCVGGLPGSPATGGGALQLSTSGLIAIDGRIDIAGAVGGSGPGIDVGGGGAGGSLLLEGAGITITATSVIDAKGGAGFQACTTPSQTCGAAGTGANGTAAATNGGDAVATVSRAGGGGGGLGRMRANVGRRGFTLQQGAVVDAVSTQGSVVVP
jgi:hypothetical protein